MRLKKIIVGKKKEIIIGKMEVRNEWKKRGIGGRIMRMEMEEEEKEGKKMVIIVGEENY